MSFERWKKIKLNDALEVLIDYRGKTPQKTFSGIPLITAKIVKDGFIQEPTEFIAEDNYSAWMTRGIPNVGDVVLTVEAPLGEVAQLRNSKVALAQRIVTLRGKKGVLDNGYLKYFLQSDIGQARLKERETGTTVTGIKQSELRLVEIDAPDYHTQRRIAAVLSSLDDKIELNRQTNQTLEAIAQTLFKEWFVDLHFPGASGKMPPNWTSGKLHEMVELNPRLAIKKGIPAKYVEMKDLSECSAIIKNYIHREFTSGSKFQNGDTLLARITPCLENGKTGLVSFLKRGEIGWGSTEFIVMRGKQLYSTYFVYCLTRHTPFREFAIKSMVGSSGRQRVVENILADFTLTIPSEGALKNFNSVVEPLFLRIKNNQEQIQTLTLLRDTLLPKLMKGEISINQNYPIYECPNY